MAARYDVRDRSTWRRGKAYPIVAGIIAWEDGDMDPDQEAEFFQALVDTGTAWELQGTYGRRAAALLAAGVIEAQGPPATRAPDRSDAKAGRMVDAAVTNEDIRERRKGGAA
jgi:hypothetical protein